MLDERAITRILMLYCRGIDRCDAELLRSCYHEDAHGVWSFGESAAARRSGTPSLQAPDFALPDLDGHIHRLADYRGRKVFLVFWASW